MKLFPIIMKFCLGSIFLLMVTFSHAQNAGLNTGLYFDGIDDYVDFGSDASILNDALASTSGFTIEAWIKTHEIGSPQTILSKWNESKISTVKFSILPSGKLKVKPNDGVAGESTSSIVPKKWTHVAATYDGETVKLFINAVEDYSQSYSGSFGASLQDIYIGASRSDDILSSTFNGQIDEVKIFNAARSQVQIQLDMDSRSSDGAVGYWNFDDDLNTDVQNEVTDLGSSATNGILTNGALWAFRVTDNINDTGIGTLRWAIDQANTDDDTDYIDFSIAGSGPHRIVPTLVLPSIDQPIFIDGYSQEGSAVNTNSLDQANSAVIQIILDGEVPSSLITYGLYFTTGSDNSTINGMSIVGFDRVVSAAINISIVSNIEVLGNFIGIEPDGITINPNENGIDVSSGQGFTIGGNEPKDQNIISGNLRAGIRLSEASNFEIANNKIGVRADGLGQDSGNGNEGIVFFETTLLSGNVISDNVIAYNGAEGVLFAGDSANAAMNNNLIYCNSGSNLSLNQGTYPTIMAGKSAPSITLAAISGIDIEGLEVGDIVYVYKEDGICDETGSIELLTSEVATATSITVDNVIFNGGEVLFVQAVNVGGNSSPFSATATVTLPPSLTSSSPLLNAINIAPESEIVLSFNSNIQAASLNASSIVITGSYTGSIEGIFSGGNTSTITFNPTNNFYPGELISVTVASGLQAIDGQAAISETFQFTVQSQIGSGVFSPDEKIIGTSADGPLALYAADIDGDGDLDVMSASRSDDKIAWYENGEDHNFSENILATTGSRPTAVFAADIDVDGDMDLLSTYSDDNKVAWYQNDGEENFFEIIITNSTTSPSDVFAVDLDSDGDLDVLCSSNASNNIAWYENDGEQNFTEQIVSNTASAVLSIYAADIDGDGDMDVLSASRDDDRIAWYMNDGDQNFTETIISSSAQGARSVYAVDMDGDGDMDVLSGSFDDDKIAWYENDNEENFTEKIISTAANGVGTVYAVDMDGDGDLDVLSTSFNDDKVAFFANDGAQNFTENIVSTSAKADRFEVYAADIDGDDVMDIISAFGDKEIAWYEQIVPDFQGMPFITTWITSDSQITIPTTGEGYDYDLLVVNQSNPSDVFNLSNQTSNATVTGLTNGETYRVEIIGDFPRIYFNGESEKDKIQSIEQWGDIVWTSMEKAFDGCSNLTYNATDAPNLSMVTDMTFMFSGATLFNGAIGSWDVSGVTDFAAMFIAASSFNQDISTWDMSAALNINSMFNSAPNFNQDISGWNVSSVESMNGTFNGATQFNQPIGSWDVSNVKEMRLTFNNASSFNQPLDSWNTSSCTIFFRMFEGATSFDQSLASFDVTGVSESSLTRMLDNSGLSVENYDATLNGWSSQPVQSDLAFQANGMTYSSIGQEGRDILTDTFDWIITGDEFISSEEALLRNDSLALAALYTSTNGTNWINRSNWLTSELSTWFGVTVADGRVTQLELPDNNLKGNVPETFTNLTGIQVINLEGNELTSFPDMSSVESFIALNLARNRLTFKHLLPNKNVPGLIYTDQKRFGQTLYDTIDAGTDYLLSIEDLGAGAQYQWRFGKLKPGQPFNNEVSNLTGATTREYTVEDIDINSQGTYRVAVTHPDLANLTIQSRNRNIMAKTDFSGKISVTRNSVTSVVNDAEVFVWRQTPSGPFVKEDSAKVNNTGDYLFEDIVLGKFVVVAKPDREKPAYKDVLQTYYVSEITYKKADTLNLDGFAENINIDLQTYKITPPVINGAIIRGFVTEEFEENIPDEEASRILARRKVRKAACSMRKFKSTGRSEQNEDELEDEIAYYIETDDEGYFNFTGVAEGRYSLNIEFPGVPMDPNSAIEFVIGGDKENQIFDVNVLVKQTQIEVKLNDILFSVRPHIKDIKLYPNPTAGGLSFDYTVYRKLNNLKVQLLNSQGVILEERPVNYRKATYKDVLDLTPYSTGVYFIVFTDEAGTFAQHIKVSRK